MKCPNCNTELTLGAKIALCLNCGTTQPLPAGQPSGSATSAAPAPSDAANMAQSAPTPAVMPPMPLVPIIPTTETLPTPEPVSQPAVVGLVPPVADSVQSPQPGLTPSLATKQPRRKLILAVIVGVPLLLVGGSGAYAYNAYQIAPGHALVGYLNKLVNSKTGKYSGTISYRGESSESSSMGISKVDITVAGAYDITDQKNPKADLTLGGSAGAYGLKAQLRTLDKTAYFKLDSLELVQNFGLTLSKDWYKIVLDDNAEANKCTSQSSKNSKNFLGSQVLTDLPLKNVKTVSLWETVAGHRTTHYRGELNNAKLQAYIDKANQDLSADCKITLSAKELEDTNISYDLWSGADFDRLRIRANDTKSKSQIESTVDSSGYNKPVKIVAPANAKELKDILSGLYGGDTTSSTSSPSPASSPSPTSASAVSLQAKARDTQRQADLRSLQKGLEVYFVDNSAYPVALINLTQGQDPIYKTIPVDPVGKSPYGYVYTPTPAGCKTTCDNYTLSARLENAAAIGTNIKNGVYTLVAPN